MADVPNRVCIIGAGSSGITAAKALKEKDIPFDCYEAGEQVGGNWVYENKNGMSSAYKSLFINTSRERMQYSDFPMPDHYPVFPHHTHIAEYFNNYVEHFNVRPHIRFNTKVMAAEPLENGGWEITLDDGSQHRYRALMVANGHHWDIRWPEPPFEGHFDGSVIHSHYYKVPDTYAGKYVLVVGFGNSAMDIAVETSRVSTLFGPIIRLQVGKLTDFGLPEPDHPILHAHPTVSSEILNRIIHGCIKPKPNIQRLDGDGVIFTDGTRERVDCIVYCTGYKVTFPFFRPEVVEARNNDLLLFRRVFHPLYPDLFFIGLLQPLGAIMPLAELQSKWVASYLLGRYALPSPAEMKQDIQREREEVRKRYGNSPRHTMQVDVEPYVKGVLKEMKRGAKRLKHSPLVQREDKEKAL